jgi:protein pelota
LKVSKISPLKRLVTITPETTLDLLNLFMVVEEGDIVYAMVGREMKKERSDGSYDSERVRVEVGVEVEKKSLNPVMRRLDLLGVIRYESREMGLLGKYHTIHVGRGTELTLESRRNFPRLEGMASYYRSRPQKRIAVVLLDDEGMSISSIGPEDTETLYRKRITSAGKHDLDERLRSIHQLFSSGATVLEKQLDDDVEILVFGPSIYLDDFMKYLREHRKDLLKRIRKAGYVSDSSAAGLPEILRSGLLHDYEGSLKVVADAEAVETLLARLASKPEAVAVGLREVLTAVEMGAVERLLISEDFLWERLVEPDVTQLLQKAEAHRANLQVIASNSEPSDKLNSLGGVAALLRYSVDLSFLKTR